MAQFATSPITRVENISKKDFVENYYKFQKPVLITGLTKDWPAYTKWRLEYIQERSSDQIVPLYDNEPAKDKESVYGPKKEMKLYDYIEILKTKPTDLRIFFYEILKKMPELTNDFEYPEIGLKLFKKLPALFFREANQRYLCIMTSTYPTVCTFILMATKALRYSLRNRPNFCIAFPIPFII